MKIDQPYSEDLENDASNLFEDGEDFFDTFKWESRVNAKRHWKVAGTPWQNVVDGIPESYRFVRWEQHSDVDDNEEFWSDDDEEIVSEKDIDDWFENPNCEDLESNPDSFFEDVTCLYMADKEDDAVPVTSKNDSITLGKPIKSILKNKPRDLLIGAKILTSLQKEWQKVLTSVYTVWA